MIKIKANIILLFLGLSIFFVDAQNRGRSFDLEKFKEERAQYFIREIGLTPTEAKIFIPLCNELMEKKFQINRSVRSDVNEIRQQDRLTDRDYIKITDDAVEVKLKEALLEKEYHQKFKKILPPEKLYKYQIAELKFMRRVVRNANK